MPLGNRQHSAPPAQKEKRQNGGTIRPPKPEWGQKKYLYSGKVDVGGVEWNMYLFPPNGPGDYYGVSFVKPSEQPSNDRRPAYRRPQESYQEYDERLPPDDEVPF